ncbi:MAG: DUF58 domain-containing protein [Brumimicrobium sp.]|nr:DUF58 domain-containing protein [Brumimicrobium sp.]MCO5269727.1 DUF58 domain-containing protein [Brumimicrobium sp.]
MDISELLKKVQDIEIKTKRNSKLVFSGGYQSAFKGKGMIFSEVKEYQYGDDVRTIDWNVTARFDTPYVKVFEEERELSIVLIIDVSASNFFGSKNKSKLDLILETTAVLALSAVANNDKVGAIFVTDEVEKYIPPKKGKPHALRILRELISFESTSNGTHLNKGIQFYINMVRRKGICFIISDFIDEHDFQEGLKIANSRHDMVAIRITDPAEKNLPKIGLRKMFLAEGKGEQWVNTNSSSVQRQFHKNYKTRESKLNNLLWSSGVDHAVLSTDNNHLVELKKLFLTRRR